jgi:hypothetical protein
MKRGGKIAICLAGGLALNAGLRAEDAVPSGNPYASIVARNVFSLNPPVPVVAPTPVTEPPPKITPNGIMAVFGHWEVLFKVSELNKGQPAKDEYYKLSEGQRKDDIEVTHINAKAGVITFNNHGTVQELPLANEPVSAPPTISPTLAANIPFPRIPPSGNNEGNRPGGPGISGVNPGGPGGGNLNAGLNNNNINLQNLSSASRSYSGTQLDMSPEEQAIMIEVNREATKQQVLEGTMPPLPPTPVTPADATGLGGAPLVAPQ